MHSAPTIIMEDPEQAIDSVHPTHENQLSRELMDSSQGDIEKLGRKRPAVFKNIFMEVGFCFSILASNLVSVSPFTILAPPPPGPKTLRLPYSRVSLLYMSQQQQHVVRSDGQANNVR